MLHAFGTTVQRSSVKAHDLGLWLSASALLVACLSIPPLTGLTWQIATYKDPAAILWATNAACGLSLTISSLTISRRPDVSFQGRKVDGQRTVSALSRLTWSWVQPLLQQASEKNDLDLDDVPQGDCRLRSEDLQRDWDSLAPRATLFRTLVWAYKGRLSLLWIVIVVRCLVSVVPFWTMLRIIKILEERGNGESRHTELMALIVLMAGSNLLDAVRKPSLLRDLGDIHLLMAWDSGLKVGRIGSPWPTWPCPSEPSSPTWCSASL